jgi:hypothetical protein
VGAADGVALGAADSLVLGEGLAVGLGEELGLGLGEELADELALGPADVPALRLGFRLAMALLVPLLHPAARHPASRIAATTARLWVRRRMADPSAGP